MQCIARSVVISADRNKYNNIMKLSIAGRGLRSEHIHVQPASYVYTLHCTS